MLRSKQDSSRKELELEEEFKPDFLSTCEVCASPVASVLSWQ